MSKGYDKIKKGLILRHETLKQLPEVKHHPGSGSGSVSSLCSASALSSRGKANKNKGITATESISMTDKLIGSKDFEFENSASFIDSSLSSSSKAATLYLLGRLKRDPITAPLCMKYI